MDQLSTRALFLDRDGVINRRLPDDYVKHVAEFEFLPQVREVLAALRPHFGRVVIVTNQQGIGKGLMTEADLAAVHTHMLAYLNAHTSLVDKVYHCPHLAREQCPCRKPQPGMAWQALGDFPEIDLTRSVMVGDSPSDMEFGRNAGMHTVFFGQAPTLPLAQAHCAHWQALGQYLKNQRG